MLVAHDVRECSMSDFVRLFEQACPRFFLNGVASGAEDESFNSLLRIRVPMLNRELDHWSLIPRIAKTIGSTA
jgi:hypothetical protein